MDLIGNEGTDLNLLDQRFVDDMNWDGFKLLKHVQEVAEHKLPDILILMVFN